MRKRCLVHSGRLFTTGGCVTVLHYAEVLASYCVDETTTSNLKSFTTSTPPITHLALPTMSKIPLPENSSQYISAETTTFNNEAHVNFFEETFQVYGLELSKWCKYFIGYNAKLTTES